MVAGDQWWEVLGPSSQGEHLLALVGIQNPLQENDLITGPRRSRIICHRQVLSLVFPAHLQFSPAVTKLRSMEDSFS